MNLADAILSLDPSPFADTYVGRVLVPLTATLLAASIIGGSAWARSMSKTAASTQIQGKENGEAIDRLTTEVTELAKRTESLADSTQVLLRAVGEQTLTQTHFVERTEDRWSQITREIDQLRQVQEGRQRRG